MNKFLEIFLVSAIFLIAFIMIFIWIGKKEGSMIKALKLFLLIAIIGIPVSIVIILAVFFLPSFIINHIYNARVPIALQNSVIYDEAASQYSYFRLIGIGALLLCMVVALFIGARMSGGTQLTKWVIVSVCLFLGTVIAAGMPIVGGILTINRVEKELGLRDTAYICEAIPTDAELPSTVLSEGEVWEIRL